MFALRSMLRGARNAGPKISRILAPPRFQFHHVSQCDLPFDRQNAKVIATDCKQRVVALEWHPEIKIDERINLAVSSGVSADICFYDGVRHAMQGRFIDAKWALDSAAAYDRSFLPICCAIITKIEMIQNNLVNASNHIDTIMKEPPRNYESNARYFNLFCYIPRIVIARKKPATKPSPEEQFRIWCKEAGFKERVHDADCDCHLCVYYNGPKAKSIDSNSD